MEYAHLSVLVREVIDILKPKAGKRYLDGTLGGGGHSERILIESSPDGQVLALDWDDEALAAARDRLAGVGARIIMRQASFAAAAEILAEINWPSIDGAILDLGVSSHQLDAPERGFSFRISERLDMRMDRRQSLDAFEIVNGYSAADLERIFKTYGEEPRARRIAAAIVSHRRQRPIESTGELAELIARAKGARAGERHPATLCFQALRIAVNQELDHLKRFLERGYELFSPGGRLVVISFHSLEDRLVKTAFRKWSRDCLCPPRAPLCTCGWSRKTRLLTTRPVRPSAAESQTNPRARSAKLRAVERI
ncbi:MAG: 16S rRNA (cytosine(1402)-N(4))-methyltransferase RsmH [Deltaproteobacteria bacterium]|nr:16S rRNA (cytosine(1402)-N(4))-methyltransferase RsmH [Deltaproteobacteria bacterium]